MWFQDAREKSRNGEPIFTDPYVGVGTKALTITPAAPVYAADRSTLLGVVGIDMDFEAVEASILGLRVAGEEGYAYLLTPMGGGVAVHPDTSELEEIKDIFDLETGVDENEFGSIVVHMAEKCAGSSSYQKKGERWLLSWDHETASRSGTTEKTDKIDPSGGPTCSTGGFIIVVTVSEAALLEVSVIEVKGSVGWCAHPENCRYICDDMCSRRAWGRRTRSDIRVMRRCVTRQSVNRNVHSSRGDR